MYPLDLQLTDGRSWDFSAYINRRTQFLMTDYLKKRDLSLEPWRIHSGSQGWAGALKLCDHSILWEGGPSQQGQVGHRDWDAGYQVPSTLVQGRRTRKLRPGAAQVSEVNSGLVTTETRSVSLGKQVSKRACTISQTPAIHPGCNLLSQLTRRTVNSAWLSYSHTLIGSV